MTPKDEIDLSFNINPLRNKEVYTNHKSIIEENYVNNLLQSKNNYTIAEQTDLSYGYIGPVLSYNHKFNKKGTKNYKISLDYSAYLQPLNETNVNTISDASTKQQDGHIYIEENEKMFDANFDLNYPLNDTYTLTSGISISTDYIPRTTIQNGTFDARHQLIPFLGKYHKQEINFARNIYAGYFTFSGKIKKWSYQMGLRAELTDRVSDFTYNLTETANNDQHISASKQFADVFPSGSLMYSFSENKQLSVSYSRRIRRQNYFQLMPLRQYDNPFQYTIGNALLQPLYKNNFEISYLNTWDKDYVSAELFLSQGYNLSTYLKKIDDEGKIFIKPENFGTSISLGSILSANYHLKKWWNTNFSLSLYQKTLYVRTEAIQKDIGNFHANIKLNNTFTLPKKLSLRLNLSYFSPTYSAQSTGSDLFLTKFSVKKRFNKHWYMSVYVNNIFGNIYTHRYTKTPYLQINQHQKEYQYFGFSLAYNFNNRK